MINTINLPPFKRMCVTIGNLPSSFMESMSYYEALCWLYDYFEKTLLPAINTNSEAITELQNAFVTLKSYVDDYFENLDVQEEINNKLDAMADSGELTEIIAQYLELAGILVYDSVDDMKNADNLSNGSTTKTLGYHTISDGGGALYKIRNITNEDVVDEMRIIALNDDNLIAEIIVENDLNIKCFGAIGDGNTDNSEIFENAILYCKNYKHNLYIPIGIYNVDTQFNIDFSLKIYGDHTANWHYNTDNLSNSLEYGSIINIISNEIDNPETYLFTIGTTNRGCFEINDIHIQGQNNKQSCINLVYAGWTFYSNNLTIDNFFYKAINCLTQYDSNINNLTIERCGKGIYNDEAQYAIFMGRNLSGDTNTNAIHINNLHMEFCRYYINFNNSQDISINNSKIEIFRYIDTYKNREDIGQVNNDITNPHILINTNNETRVIFTNTTFCFRGLYNWNLANPLINNLSDLPYAIKTEGSDNTGCDISFVGCTIFSPSNDGGFRFLNNAGSCFIHIRDCFLYNLALRTSALNGNKISIVNSRLFYYVHSSIESFVGVGSNLTQAIITSSSITTNNNVINRCTNNAYNGFKIFNLDTNSIMNNNYISPFCNIPVLYNSPTNLTFTTTSGNISSNTYNVTKTGNAKLKLLISVPSGGDVGRLYIKLTSNRSSGYTLLFNQMMIPNNTTNLTFYIEDNFIRGETLTLELLQQSGTDKTLTGSIQFMYT